MNVSNIEFNKAYKSLRTVFRKPSYVIIALIIAVSVFSFAIWLPNFDLMKKVLTSDSASIFKKVSFSWSLLGGISTNFTPAGAFFLAFISILVGMNMALTAYYFKQRISFQKTSGASLFGMVLGIIGVGCSSCGSLVLASIIGLSATASLVGFLPLAGQEFNILAVLILLVSFYVTAKKAYDPLICEI